MLLQNAAYNNIPRVLFESGPKVDIKSQVKFLITDKHILRFAKNNRTVARKAFCLIVICVSCSSGFLGRSVWLCKFFFLNLSLSNISDRTPRGESCQNWPEVLPPVFRAVWFFKLKWSKFFCLWEKSLLWAISKLGPDSLTGGARLRFIRRVTRSRPANNTPFISICGKVGKAVSNGGDSKLQYTKPKDKT